jgi:hypothetical protein
MYAPNSAGGYIKISKMTIRTAKVIFPLLNEVASINSKRKKVYDVESFADLVNSGGKKTAELLGKFFEKHGSDKSANHSYHYIYASILASLGSRGNLLEIGLGTNHVKYVSNMGSRGKPGASLKAFRDFLPNWNIYGADVDKSILFFDERIKTFFVDQLKENTLDELTNQFEEKLNLIIDDGLHSPEANLQVLKFAYSNLKVGGWLIIEDINYSALEIWEIVDRLIEANFENFLINDEGTLVFASRRFR